MRSMRIKLSYNGEPIPRPGKGCIMRGTLGEDVEYRNRNMKIQKHSGEPGSCIRIRSDSRDSKETTIHLKYFYHISYSL